MKIPILKAKNFILRPFRKGDEESLAENINDKIIIRNTLIPHYPYRLKHARAWLKRVKNDLQKTKLEDIRWAIDIKGEVVGGIGLHKIEEKHKASIGYWLVRKYWGRGIMTEAARLIIKFCFKKLKLRRIYAGVFPWNKASMRVLEKNGFRLEGILRKNIKKGKIFIDDYLFAKVRQNHSINHGE